MISTKHDRPHIRFTSIDTITVPKHNCSHVFMENGHNAKFADGSRATCTCRRNDSWIYIPLEVSANYANPVETYEFMREDIEHGSLHLAVDVDLTDAFVMKYIGVSSVRKLLEYFDFDETHRFVQNFYSRRTPNMVFARVEFLENRMLPQRQCRSIEILTTPDAKFDCRLCDTVNIAGDYDLVNLADGPRECRFEALRSKWGGVIFVLEGLKERFNPPPFQPSDSSMRQQNCIIVSKHLELDIVETTWLVAYHYGYAAKLMEKYPTIRAFLSYKVSLTLVSPFYRADRVTWYEEYQYSWPEIRTVLLGACLALTNLHLPVYVLLELIDWLPLMWLFPRIVKIQTIERFVKSATKITENRICNKK